MTTPILEVRELVKTYRPPGLPAVEALTGIDLEVDRGEIFGLLGPNGAGKTTAISIITTRHAPTSGTVRVDGIDVVAHPARSKRQVGVAPQMPNLDNSLKVEEVLYLHGRYFGLTQRDARRRTQALLERFHLTEKARTRPIELSGGMVRRLLVARALMHEPSLLLLDEATVGVDPQTRRAMWDEIEALRSEGTSVLVTTHYIEEADILCDRVAIIDHGRILSVDTPAALKTLIPAGTRIELALAPDMRSEAAEALLARPEVAVVEKSDDGLRLYVTGGEGTVPGVVSTVVDAGARLHHVSVQEPTLEDVFIHFTGKELRD